MTEHAKLDEVPPERDFTAGLAGGPGRSLVGLTGEAAWDERSKLVNEGAVASQESPR